MSAVVLHSIIMVVGVLIASSSQALLKAEALKEHDSKLKEYLNVRVISGYGLMFLSTFFAIYAYRVISVSLGAVLDSTGYIFVTLIGFFIFKEKINLKRIIALALIVSGITVYALMG